MDLVTRVTMQVNIITTCVKHDRGYQGPCLQDTAFEGLHT